MEFHDLPPGALSTLGRLRLISSRLDDEAEAVLRKHDLDPEAFAALEALLHVGTPNRLGLAELAHVVMAKSGGLLDRLGQLGAKDLVTRAPDSSPTFVLTTSGRALVEHVTQQLATFESQLTSAFTESELALFDTTLSRLFTRLSAANLRPTAVDNSYAT